MRGKMRKIRRRKVKPSGKRFIRRRESWCRFEKERPDAIACEYRCANGKLPCCTTCRKRTVRLMWGHPKPFKWGEAFEYYTGEGSFCYKKRFIQWRKKQIKRRKPIRVIRRRS